MRPDIGLLLMLIFHPIISFGTLGLIWLVGNLIGYKGSEKYDRKKRTKNKQTKTNRKEI